MFVTYKNIVFTLKWPSLKAKKRRNQSLVGLTSRFNPLEFKIYKYLLQFYNEVCFYKFFFSQKKQLQDLIKLTKKLIQKSFLPKNKYIWKYIGHTLDCRCD